MAWLRSAMNKAVEVGNKSNLTRAMKNYTDSVVHQAGQAVAEGAKLLQDRIVTPLPLLLLFVFCYSINWIFVVIYEFVFAIESTHLVDS